MATDEPDSRASAGRLAGAAGGANGHAAPAAHSLGHPGGAHVPDKMPEIPPEESLIQYPSDFPIKVLGPEAPGFVEAITDVVRRHDPGFDPATIEQRVSGAGNYRGLTVTVRATSREQLDALYRELTSHPMVKVVL